MTFDVTIDDSNDLLVADYLKQVNENLSEIAQESTIEMIEDINYLSAKAKILMEEYRKNPVSYKFSDVMAEFESE